MDTNLENAKKYVKELFTGASKIISFCKIHDCSKCANSLKLYKRAFDYHNTEIVQNEFSRYAAVLQNTK